MRKVGVQNGDVEGKLSKVVDVDENEVEMSVSSMTSMMEPIIIVVMAAIIGFIIVSILLPIMEMNTLIK